ncbi:Pyocin large subunit-like protein (fragment) [Methylacidimicrobium sp. AP8]
MAQEFLRRAQAEGLPTKVDSKGVIRIYDPATNTFGSYNAAHVW